MHQDLKHIEKSENQRTIMEEDKKKIKLCRHVLGAETIEGI